jgi:hypothetical protein
VRIRTIKPEFWRNRKLASLGREVHDFAARLITASDDEGFCEADPALLAGDLYPFDPDAQRFIRKALPELERIGFIIIKGGEFGVVCLPKFREHQRINRPSPSRLKARFEQVVAIAQFSEPSLSTHGALTEDSVSPHGVLSEPSSTEVEREREVEQGKGTGIVAEPAAPATLMPGPDDLGHAWNTDTGPPLPKVTLPLAKGRKDSATAALKRRSLPEWRRVFQKVNTSAFCRGGSESKWLADFDWAIRPEGKKPEPATKVLEGAYDRGTGPPNGAAPSPTPRPEGRVLI